MTVPETPDELRAWLDRLPAEMERLLEERAEREYSTSYETSGFYVFSRSHLDDFIEYAIALIDWGTIDALLARLTAAEAELDRLTTGLDIFFDQAKGMRGPERGRLAHALLRDFWRILARRRTSDVKRHCVRGRDDGWWQCVDCDEAFPTWPDDFVPCPKGRP